MKSRQQDGRPDENPSNQSGIQPELTARLGCRSPSSNATKFYITTLWQRPGNVALVDISRETNYFHKFVPTIHSKSPSPFFSLGYLLSMFSNFGHFSVLCSYKNGSYKNVSDQCILWQCETPLFLMFRSNLAVVLFQL